LIFNSFFNLKYKERGGKIFDKGTGFCFLTINQQCVQDE